MGAEVDSDGAAGARRRCLTPGGIGTEDEYAAEPSAPSSPRTQRRQQHDDSPEVSPRGQSSAAGACSADWTHAATNCDSGNGGRAGGAAGTVSIVAVLLALLVVVAINCSTALKVMTKAYTLPASERDVCVYIQQSKVGSHGFTLPGDTSPQELVSFLQRKAWLSYRTCEEQLYGKTVYATTASSNRWDETLFDQAQVDRIGLGRISAFVFVWITPEDQCADGEVPSEVGAYVRQRFSKDIPIAWVCFWDERFAESPTLTASSLLDMEAALTG
eukprot:TRINITY_DN55267_c0_g1_i1.p1 TRINITY_DN55267_c0_g1~~TRINITY_DN55267_c0_g1_i1.p1  ORF type:complete len:273 (-),score=56.61 TRINITY_DN55267_c0_g1_i1:99-917(-)